MSEEQKLDKRSKEYKDKIQAGKDAELKKVFEAENTIKMAEMEKKMEEMEKLLRNVGTITADNAKKLTVNSSNKDKDNNSTSLNDIKKALGVKPSKRVKSRKVSKPRSDEFNILSNFVFTVAPQIALDKDLVLKIGVCLMYKDVANLLEYIRRDDYLRKKALENEVVSPDFMSVIIPQKN